MSANQALVTERITAIQKAMNAHSVEALMKLYSPSIDFSDFAIGSRNLNYSALTTFYTNMFAAAGNFTISTRSISGTKEHTTWEWNCSFNFNGMMDEIKDDQDFKPELADGRPMKMVGVSVTWWDEEGKIVKNNDYSKVVESFA